MRAAQVVCLGGPVLFEHQLRQFEDQRRHQADSEQLHALHLCRGYDISAEPATNDSSMVVVTVTLGGSLTGSARGQPNWWCCANGQGKDWSHWSRKLSGLTRGRVSGWETGVVTAQCHGCSLFPSSLSAMTSLLWSDDHLRCDPL